VPHLFFAASGRRVRVVLRPFAEEVAASDLPGADLFDGIELGTWDAALRLLSSALPDDGSVVVLDEIPYLMAADDSFEGTLQRAFDRELARKRVLLIGIGSDLSMMEALNEYGRPFHQRATEMVVPPPTPVEVGALLDLDPADAFDAHLVTGGLPLICNEWTAGMKLWDYLTDAVSDPTSALLVSGERSLAAEFPSDIQARSVLGAIGSGERTFTNIGRAAGDIPQGSLNRSLVQLVSKRVVAVDEPLSTKPASKDKRYRVADPYLRFWLAFLGPHLGEIERGRGDRVLARIRSSWTSWRGRAIEPVIARRWSGWPRPSQSARTACRVRWGGTGRGPIAPRSTSSSPTGLQQRSASWRSGRSSGWRRHPSTATTWASSMPTGPSCPVGCRHTADRGRTFWLDRRWRDPPRA